MPDNMQSYPIHVIILNWNLPEDTINCVRSVDASVGFAPNEVQIVIVDNGSTDDSVARFRAEFGDNIHIISTGRNLGFAGGMNAGIEWSISQGAVLMMLLNNDTIVHPQMLSLLVQASTRYPKAGVLGPVIYYWDKPDHIWRFADKEYGWLPIPIKMSAKQLTKAKGQPFKVDYVTGCGMLIRSSVIETVGGFNDQFFMYFEDADFCQRVRDSGYEIYCVPTATMWHKVSQSAKQDRPAERYARNWGRVTFYKLHHPWKMFGLVHIYIWVRLLMSTIRDFVSGHWNLISPGWAGTIDAYKASSSCSKLHS
jgi:hypothetical protein